MKNLIIETRVNTCSLATIVLYYKRNKSLPTTRSATIAMIVDHLAQVLRDNGHEYIINDQVAIEILSDVNLIKGSRNLDALPKLTIQTEQHNLAHRLVEDMEKNPAYYKTEESRNKRVDELRRGQ